MSTTQLQEGDSIPSEHPNHHFSYLLKEYEDGGLVARVREIPAVFVSAQSQNEIESEIRDATLHYLHTFEDEHRKAINNEFRPILESPKGGVVIAINNFEVKC